MAPKDPQSSEENTYDQIRVLKNRKTYLSRMLKAIEDKHTAAKGWIENNEKRIVTSYLSLTQALDKAKESNDLSDVVKVLTGAGDAAGVLLDIRSEDQPRLAQTIEETFSSTSAREYDALMALIQKTPLGVPASALEYIDEEAQKDIEDAEAANAEDANKDSDWWSRVSGKEKKALEAELQSVKADLLGMSMEPIDGRAMIRSLFDYVEAASLPEHTENYTQGETPDIEHLQTQYESAEYVINLAQHDFNETLTAFTGNISAQTLEYKALWDFVEHADPSDEKIGHQLEQILYNSPDADTMISWFSEQDNTRSFFFSLQKRLENNASFYACLNQLNKKTKQSFVDDQRDAEVLLKNALTHAIERSSKLTNDKALKIALKTISKSAHDINLAVALKDIKAFEMIDQSNMTEETKVEIIDTLMKVTKPDYNEFAAKTAVEFLRAFDAKEFANVNLLMNRGDYPEIEAYVSMMRPSIDIFDAAIQNPSKDFSSKVLISEIRSKHSSVNNVETLAVAIAHAGEYEEWANALPTLYSLFIHDIPRVPSVPERIVNMLTTTEKDGTRLIDYIAKKDDEDLLAKTLSFLPTPPMRANFLRQVSEDAPTKALTSKYKNYADILDGEFIEFADNCLLNPDNLVNIYYSNNRISYLADGRTSSLPNTISETEASAVFENILNREGFVYIGNELAKPENIDIVQIMNTGSEEKLLILADNNTTTIALDPGETEAAVSQFEQANPNFLNLGEYLVNTDTVSAIYFDGDVINIIYEDQCALSAKCPEETKQGILAELETKGHFITVGNAVLNAKKVEAVAYHEDEDELTFIAGDANFYAGQKVHMLDRTSGMVELGPVTCGGKDKAKELMSALEAQGFACENGTAINTANISKISTNVVDGTPQTVVSLSKLDLSCNHLTASEQSKLSEKCANAVNMIKHGT